VQGKNIGNDKYSKFSPPGILDMEKTAGSGAGVFSLESVSNPEKG
jgi:hypothetical protein